MSKPAAASPKLVPCPGCGRPCEFAPANRFRPFCSARCKDGDFGAWASERYRVEAPPPLDDEAGQSSH
jgi:endogenous inhibitor of DNA gyrase (YacG/DUF329 family)